MRGSFIGWRAVLWFVAIYHVTMGGILFVSGELALKVAKLLGGVSISGSPEMGILGEILACYLIAFGLMVALAAWDPVKYRGALSVGLVLFALRSIQRLVFADKVIAVFHVPPVSHYTGTAVVIIFAVVLGLFRLKVAKSLTA